MLSPKNPLVRSSAQRVLHLHYKRVLVSEWLRFKNFEYSFAELTESVFLYSNRRPGRDTSTGLQSPFQ